MSKNIEIVYPNNGNGVRINTTGFTITYMNRLADRIDGNMIFVISTSENCIYAQKNMDFEQEAFAEILHTTLNSLLR